jgi:WD40 repeat protein
MTLVKMTSTLVPAAPVLPREVYVGPRPFKNGETLYCRDREAAELMSLLISQRLVLLHSPSGAGKTSLIQARLVPALQEEGFDVPMCRAPVEESSLSCIPQPVIIRVNLHAAEVEPAAINRYTLSAILSLELHRPREQRRSISELALLTLGDYLQEAFPAARDLDFRAAEDAGGFRPLLLLFDQFEELLALDPMDEVAKAEFIQQLGLTLCNESLWALFAIREDFLGALEPYLPAIPTHLAARYRLDLLRAEDVSEAIEEPARKAGVSFQEGLVRKLTEELRQTRVQRPDGEFESKPGLYVEPVHLQVVCQSLWTIKGDSPVITAAHLEKLSRGSGSGVERVLAAYYAEWVAKASEQGGVSERLVRDWFGKQLVSVQGVRRPTLVADALLFGLTRECLDVLDKAFLIRRDYRSSTQWYELTHDRLVTPVLNDNETWRAEHLSPFQQQAELWAKHDRSRDLLIAGNILDEGERWAGAHPGLLTETEQEFLTVCRDARLAAQKELELAFQSRRNEELETAKAELEMLKRWAEWLVYVSQIALAQNEWRDGDARAAWLYLRATQQDFRGWEYNYLLALFKRKDGQTLSGHHGRVPSVAYSPDGAYIVSGGEDSTLRLWNAVRGQHIATFQGHTRPVWSVAFSPDGQSIVSGSEDGTVRRWDAASGNNVFTYSGHTGEVRSVAYSPDGSFIASGSEDGTLKVWDVASGMALLTGRHFGPVWSVTWSRDGQYIASGSADNTARLWRLDSELSIRTFRGHAGGVFSVTFSPDGAYLATGSFDSTLRLWDVSGRTNFPALKGHIGPVWVVAFSPDGRCIVSGSHDSTLRLWDVESRENLSTFRGHTAGVWGAAYSPDGQRIVSSSHDEKIKIWDAEQMQEPLTLTGHARPVMAVTHQPGGARIASGGYDSTLRLWDAISGESIANLQGHTGAILTIAYSPDGQCIVTGGGTWNHQYRKWFLGELRWWDPISGENILTREDAEAGIWSVLFASGGRRLVSAGDDGKLRFWDAVTGENLATIKGHDKAIWTLACSPDGTRVVSAGQEGPLKLWSTANGEPVATLAGHAKGVWRVAYSPDGAYIVSGGEDHQLKLWDAVTGANIRSFWGHSDDVRSVAYSPDGTRIVSGGNDSALKVWDPTKDRAATLTLKGHTGAIYCVSYSPDGMRIVSGSDDATLKVWDATLPGEVEH